MSVDGASIGREEDARADQSGGDGETEASGSQSIDLDRTLEILQNRRRRMVIEYLTSEGGKVEIGELSEEIAAKENDKTVGEITSNERKRVYVGLYQCHLVKMDRAGVVHFDKPRGTVEAGPTLEQVLPYLDDIPRTGADPWPVYFAGVAAVSLAGFVPAGLLALTASTDVLAAWAVLSQVAFVVVSGLFCVRERS
jgi:hypothetical protein